MPKRSRPLDEEKTSEGLPKPAPITRKWRRENAVDHKGMPAVIIKCTGEAIPVENLYLKQKHAKALGIALPQYEECWICGSTEHRRRDCPKADRRVDGSMIQSTVVCLECRQRGHKMSECPNRGGGSGGAGSAAAASAAAPAEGPSSSGGAPGGGPLCYRCGETTHHLRDCPAPNRGGALPFAACFVCGRTGHLASACSENKNGAYPRGGSCKVCGSTAHLARDCPVEAAAGGREALAAAGGGGKGASRGSFLRNKFADDVVSGVSAQPFAPGIFTAPSNPEDLGGGYAAEPVKKSSGGGGEDGEDRGGDRRKKGGKKHKY
jgi:hypothetical protein